MAAEKTVLECARKLADTLGACKIAYNESASGVAATTTATPTSGKSIRVKAVVVCTSGTTNGTWELKQNSTTIMKAILTNTTTFIGPISFEGAVNDTFTLVTSAVSAQICDVMLLYQEF